MKRKTETEHFQKILEHPSFKANPLQAITEHINNRSIFDKVSALNFTQVFSAFFFFFSSVTIEQQARKEQLDQQRLKEKLKLKKQKRKQQKEQQKN